MVQTEFSAALNQVCSERSLEPQKVIDAVEEALVAAYRKDHPGESLTDVKVTINPETGEALVLRGEDNITPSGFGRIAAQTAKQVILQRIKEAEKESLTEEFKQKLGSLVQGYIFRIEAGNVILDLGKAQAVLPPHEQTPGEEYQVNQQLQVLIAEIRDADKGPEIIVSRQSPDFVKQLFALEVPEIDSGTVKIERVAREAGKRTKVAASSSSENVDPVGSLVGQKGIRVQSVIRELGEEKIDIVGYSDEPTEFIANALSPAKVLNVKIDDRRKTAVVEVPEDQLSLAIGKEGQNVRLAAKLTGWRIDIRGPKGERVGAAARAVTEGVSELTALGLSTRVVNLLAEASITTRDQLANLTDDQLKEIKGVGPKAIEEIRAQLGTIPAPTP